MNPELRQYVEQARFCLASVQRVAEWLPADDAELDALIAETIKENNPKAFIHVVMAALMRERRVEAKHLTAGAGLLNHPVWVGHMMMKAQGDVPEAVLAIFEHSCLRHSVQAGTLLALEDWCREHREGKLPDKLIPLARRVARNPLPAEENSQLMTLALRTNDAGLMAIIKERLAGIKPEEWPNWETAARKLGEAFLQHCRRPTCELVMLKATSELARGVTMRRAVAKVGRNEPCPCGSGKKYKHCCIEKDNERLHHSSDVAGLTQEELRSDLSSHLTKERLYRMHPHDAVTLDPLKIPTELWDMYFLKLSVFNAFDRALEAMQSIGWSKAMEDHWETALLFATRAERKDIIKRLIELREKLSGEEEVSITAGAMLVMEADNPAKVLQVMDECAKNVLADNDYEHLRQLATGMMFSRNRALGILVARGLMPLLPSGDAVTLLDRILEARDILNLPPEDPISDLVDKRNAEHEEDNAKLRAARQSLDAKAEEVRGLKEQLDGLEAEIVRRERKHAAEIAENAPMKELRRKVEELKASLNERHRERNQLRRDLQEAQGELAATRQTQPTVSAEEEAESMRREEELLLPQDAPEIHPVRLAEFPKGFLQTLSTFPQHVARAAMIMIGRLAAGEPAAFVGALRLKGMPNIMRQRIGINYRLLFRLWPERLEVIDLINRKDLDRRLKTL